ncbi:MULTISPECIES: hypothetical protein [unclassified Chamaesiphon]|uniref:hypothetical protein n=1 Tax=unclassified Chamaesiphon TaxID=2620921 RepID=UPI00286B4FA2|nr:MULTISPECIES: hypothetical protein [unclassified Chamaesiphon]
MKHGAGGRLSRSLRVVLTTIEHPTQERHIAALGSIGAFDTKLAADWERVYVSTVANVIAVVEITLWRSHQRQISSTFSFPTHSPVCCIVSKIAEKIS